MASNWSYTPKYFQDYNRRYDNERLLLSLNDGPTHNAAWASFDRWYSVDTDQEGMSGRHYVFFCRPDLNLFDEGTSSLNTKNGVMGDAYFEYLKLYYPDILASLSAEFNLSASTQSAVSRSAAVAGSGLGNSLYDTYEGGRNMPIHAFLPYLTSRVESIQLPDYIIKTDELRQPYTRFGIPYSTTAIESMCTGDFDISFRDDKYFTIRKLFYAWIYYMDGVLRDKYTPKDKYITYNALDYATSIYDILVDETGENILWWVKYTGCFPYQVPLSDVSFNRGSAPDPKCNISFKYFLCEPLSMSALVDFNYNSLGYRAMRSATGNENSNYSVTSGLVFAPSYNKNLSEYSYTGSFLGTNFVGRPCIVQGSNKGKNGHGGLKLKWLIKG